MSLKLVFIGNIAAPYQVKFCYALRAYYDTQFWFYDEIGARQSFWKIPLGEYCKILPDVRLKGSSRYLTTSHLKWLNEFNPDVVMLGGFSIPANYLAYRWAIKNKKKVIVLTERARDKQGNIKKRNFVWRLLKFLYRDVDRVMVLADDVLDQFKNEFKFGDKVIVGQYPADIDKYYSHPMRKPKDGYNFIFANRLTPIYDPLLAVDIFYKILQKYPSSFLYLNNSGELKEEVVSKIAEYNIGDRVEFLDYLKNWEDLSPVYAKCDILILPAKFSNGNFTVVEAMASGMGVVISDKILGVELIEDGVNGFRCAPDIDAFVERIERYIKDPSLFKKHTLLNREIARPYGLAGTTELYRKIISELTHK